MNWTPTRGWWRGGGGGSEKNRFALPARFARRLSRVFFFALKNREACDQSNFNCTGWPRLAILTFTLSQTIFDRKGNPFVYLPLENGTPFTRLQKDFYIFFFHFSAEQPLRYLNESTVRWVDLTYFESFTLFYRLYTEFHEVLTLSPRTQVLSASDSLKCAEFSCLILSQSDLSRL